MLALFSDWDEATATAEEQQAAGVAAAARQCALQLGAEQGGVATLGSRSHTPQQPQASPKQEDPDDAVGGESGGSGSDSCW